MAQLLVGLAASLDQAVAILFAFRGEMKLEGPAGFGLFFGDQAVLDQDLDGAMDHGAIEAEERSNLVLIELRAAYEGGQDEAAGGRALRFALEALAHGEV